MQIIIVGGGNVGATLAERLSQEKHNISVIDTRNEVLSRICDNVDVMGIVGNGASYAVQKEAGIEEADLLIAVTNSDELNMLCCLIARKAGGCQTIARVRNPVYSREISFIKEELGLSMVINPEDEAAMEIARVLKFPSALEIDTFAKGRVELVKYQIEGASALCGQSLKAISAKMKCDVLVSTVERGEEVFIPDGNFVLREKDEISIMGSTKNIVLFFKKLEVPTTRANNVFIVGGGETAYYLSKHLLSIGVDVKIVEKNKQRCNELCELLPEAMIICGDGTDRDLLLEEGLPQAESFVALTNFDEENILLSLFARSISKAKLITRIHRIAFDEIIEELNLGSVVYPKYITAESIIKYVRGMQNSIGSNIETLYQLHNDRVEALEFIVRQKSPVVDIPLQELHLKPNLLLCCINHRGQIITPGGQSRLKVGDTVVIVTTVKGLDDISDILKD
ncbi:MAG: Trk system potassium transporter TrkA [Lachnospiraceae bacterium]|nr:Trk system potassium transporter TrkA [Lachnospiraceae bacterium]